MCFNFKIRETSMVCTSGYETVWEDILFELYTIVLLFNRLNSFKHFHSGQIYYLHAKCIEIDRIRCISYYGMENRTLFANRRKFAERFVKILRDNGGVIQRRVAQLFNILRSSRCNNPKGTQPLCRTDRLKRQSIGRPSLTLYPRAPQISVKIQGIPSEILSSSKTRQGDHDFDLI